MQSRRAELPCNHHLQPRRARVRHIVPETSLILCSPCPAANCQEQGTSLEIPELKMLVDPSTHRVRGSIPHPGVQNKTCLHKASTLPGHPCREQGRGRTMESKGCLCLSTQDLGSWAGAQALLHLPLCQAGACHHQHNHFKKEKQSVASAREQKSGFLTPSIMETGPTPLCKPSFPCGGWFALSLLSPGWVGSCKK